MQRKTFGRLVRSPIFLLAILLATLAPFAAIGIYSLLHPQGEPQPNPDPVVKEPTPARPPVFLEVVTQFPGAAPEEVERQVTIPLEVGLAGMVGLKCTRSKSLFGLSCLSLEFEERIDRHEARREVIDHLGLLQALPPGVIPQLNAVGLENEVLRYVLHSPRDAQGRDLYTLSDLKACQDWILEREFRRLPGVADVTSVGGTVKGYDVHLDPDRLRRHGVTLQQVQNALAAGNANVGGDIALTVRSVGLFGGGIDPMQQVLGLKDPRAAAERLRAEELRRLREIRQVVVATVQSVAVRLEDVIEGGRLIPGDELGRCGVVVAHQRRYGRVGLAGVDRPDENDKVEDLVFKRPGEESSQVLKLVAARIKELNETPERMLPGLRIEIVQEQSQPEGATPDNALLWVHGTFPTAATEDVVAANVRTIRDLLLGYPEVQLVLSQIGGQEGLEAAGTNHVECLVLRKPAADLRGRPPGGRLPRTQRELVEEIRAELKRTVVGVDLIVSPHRRDPFLAAIVAAPDEEMVKIVGPHLAELDRLAQQVRTALTGIRGIQDVAVCAIMGRSEVEFRVDRDKCAKWGVRADDVNNLVRIAVGGQAVTRMIEGEKQFDITLRLPAGMSVLDLPVDISNNQAVPATGGSLKPPPREDKPIVATPRLRLRDLVSPLGADGVPGPKGEFERAGASTICREQGRRCLAVTFRIDADDRAAILEEARNKTAALIKAPYRAEWHNR